MTEQMNRSLEWMVFDLQDNQVSTTFLTEDTDDQITKMTELLGSCWRGDLYRVCYREVWTGEWTDTRET